MFLGHISNSMGRYEAAQGYLHEALDLARQLGSKAETAWILSGMGETLLGRKTTPPEPIYRKPSRSPKRFQMS